MMASLAQGDRESAVRHWQALTDTGVRAESANTLGYYASQAGDLTAAIDHVTVAATLVPREFRYIANLAFLLQSAGAHSHALAVLKAYVDGPGQDQVEAWLHYGTALLAASAHGALAELSERGAQRWPQHYEFPLLGSDALAAAGELEAALSKYEQLLATWPACWRAWTNGAMVAARLGCEAQAIEWLHRALQIEPRAGEILFNLGSMLFGTRQWEEAERHLAAIAPGDAQFADAQPLLWHARRQLAIWGDEASMAAHTLSAEALAARRDARSFELLSLTDDPAILQQVARKEAKQRGLDSVQPSPGASRRTRRKIRLGYFSADICNHPVGHLVAEVFGLHDRSEFEVLCYAYGKRDDSDVRQRVARDCDRFNDLHDASDAELVQRIRQDQPDILVDLGGYTAGSRVALLAQRLAPVQMHWVGYTGSLGAPGCVDYLICDGYVVPAEFEAFYDEKLLRLPACFQPNDRQRRFGLAGSRADHGLPDDACVYCYLNQVYKITPAVFAHWMTIMRAVPNSVLWLLCQNETAIANLRATSATHGVDGRRLHFARHLPHAEHLARIAHADLFLDSFPFNAHTGASDALWAGVPIVTVSGRSFASRVAGSLLGAAGLPELIAADWQQYIDIAVHLGTDAAASQALKRRVTREVLAATPAFDSPALVRALEAHYRAVLA